MLCDDARRGEIRDEEGSESHRAPTNTILARLVHGRQGVFGHREALDAGVGLGALKYRLRTGGIHLIHDGVYGVGHKDLSDDAWMHAALIAGGARAAISHWTSLRRWRLLDEIPLRPVHITLPRDEHYMRRDGIQAHRPLEFHPLDTTDHLGLRLTTVPRALLEMAPYIPAKRLALALHRAQVERRMPMSALRAVMDRAPRARGLKRLHTVAFGGAVAPNARERRFLKVVADAGLPSPRTNVLVETEDGSFLVDCLWPEHRLVYEVDDPSHATTHRMTGDRRRDGALQDAGLRVFRVTDDDLRGPGVARMLARLARRLAA